MEGKDTFALLLIGTLIFSPCVHAKTYTVQDRQVALGKKIDQAYKTNHLTLKEADSLKSKLKDVKDNEQKFKDQNGGQLSVKDTTSLEKDLNKISSKLHKQMLEKRTH